MRIVQRGSVHPVEIQIAIAVKVQPSRTPAFSLCDIAFFRTAARVDFRQANIRSHIDKVGLFRRRRLRIERLLFWR